MKLLFIEPADRLKASEASKALKERYAWEYRALWAGYLAAMVKEQHEVKFIDGTLETSVSAVVKKIKKFNPNLLGFTTYCEETEPAVSLLFTKKICEAYKKINPECKVVLGGYAATVMPLEILKPRCFDFAITGDGEYAFKELVEKLAAGSSQLADIKGLAYKEKRKIKYTGARLPIKNLDELPFPSREIYPKIRQKGERWIPLVSGRGCPWGKCSFCGIGAFYRGPHYSFRSPENIMDEVEQVIETTGNKNIRFIDEGILCRLDKIIAEKKKRKLEFYMAFNARADMIINFERNLVLGKKHGLCFVEVGIENFVDRILKIYNKGVTAEQNIQALEILYKHKIPVGIDFIPFNPWTTKEEVEYNLKMLYNYMVERRFEDGEFTPISFRNYVVMYSGTGLRADYGKRPKYLDKRVHFCLEQLCRNDDKLSGYEQFLNTKIITDKQKYDQLFSKHLQALVSKLTNEKY